jgi:SAM-dependent methyltransferase
MSKSDNKRTLQAYQDKTQEYIQATPPLDDTTKAWLDKSLGLIPADGKILEVGSGFGRDAEYIQQQGFHVECSDAVPNFVDLLRQKGFEARRLDLLTDDLGSGYDLVVADAVLLHFTPEESGAVTRKVREALNDGGVFALRMKRGNGPKWTEEKLGEPRYFYYWQPHDLQGLLGKNGFTWLEMLESYTSHNKANWMHIVAQKAVG